MSKKAIWITAIVIIVIVAGIIIWKQMQPEKPTVDIAVKNARLLGGNILVPGQRNVYGCYGGNSYVRDGNSWILISGACIKGAVNIR